MVRSVENWQDVLFGKGSAEAVADALLGDLVHYRSGQAYEDDDRKQIMNFLAALGVASPERPDNEGWQGTFQVGDPVRKVKGYSFGGSSGGKILAAYYAEEGPPGPDDERYVVKHPEGWQHIFNASQLTRAGR